MFSAIKLVEKFVLNIYDKTDDMTFARYPLAKDKQGHFYIQTFENEVVDFELLEEDVEALLEDESSFKSQEDNNEVFVQEIDSEINEENTEDFPNVSDAEDGEDVFSFLSDLADDTNQEQQPAQMDESLTLKKAHDIADLIEEGIQKKI